MKYYIEKQRVIGKCTLIKAENGVQTYQYEDGKTELIWGWNMATNVRVGDKGVMVYRSTPSWGLPFFVKDKN